MNAKQEILDELYYFDTVQPHMLGIRDVLV